MLAALPAVRCGAQQLPAAPPTSQPEIAGLSPTPSSTRSQAAVGFGTNFDWSQASAQSGPPPNLVPQHLVPRELVPQDLVPRQTREEWSSEFAPSRLGKPSLRASSLPPGQIDLTPLLLHLRRSNEAPGAASLEDEQERYHWKGMLTQSLGFIAVENGFRVMADGYFRHLLTGKPYWHDYIASLKQWNMRRWSDGDDFLVNDIGHPMQGAVSSFIEIQNDPQGRDLRIGSSPAYWRSRFHGLLWATAYSTQQKIGPLGEAALGSDGGLTYVIHCASPCPSYTPSRNKYTNNTGWTDFIMTPAGGTVWVFMEDAIDRYISDRVQDGRPDAILPKLLRAGLNPSRSMANALRLKKPWYRDFQHTGEVQAHAVHFIRTDEDAYVRPTRFELFPHFNALSLPVNKARCTTCRSLTTGPGIGFSWRLNRWLDFDSDIDHQSNASPLPSDRAGGSVTTATFGFRTGIRTPNYAIKFAVRPGFVSYDHAWFNSPTGTHLTSVSGPVIVPPAPTTTIPQTGRITHFATALSISADYGLTRHLALRAVLGNTAVRYKTNYYDRPPGRGSPPYVFFIAPNIFATNENWNYQLGTVLRF